MLIKALIAVVTVAFAATLLAPAWESREMIDSPESVYFDPASGWVFVSNIAGQGTEKDGRGWLQVQDATGRIIHAQWVKGLNAPKGMRSQDKVLWVTDIDTVLAFEIPSGRLLKKVAIPGAVFLNDVAIDKVGNVYVSDTLARVIYRGIGGRFEVFVQGDETESPNGLIVRDNELIVAAWGLANPDWSAPVGGRVYSLNLQTKAKTLITKEPLGNLDGLELASDGSLLVSDWVSGKIYRVGKQGEVSQLSIAPLKGSADIGYIPATNTVLVPYMLDSVVRAFRL
jgi:sugar lactone lactonase YvrE